MSTTLRATNARLNRRDLLRLGVAGTTIGLAGLAARATDAHANEQLDRKDSRCAQIEPGAGKWKTWVLQNGADVVVPPPPGRGQTAGEIDQLKALATQRDQATLGRIAFWDAGAPSYRWSTLAVNRIARGGPQPTGGTPNLGGLTNGRNIALPLVAMYDATIAAWYWKYRYNRARPDQFASDLNTAIAGPRSPSYPSEYAAVAAAAATVLASFYPAEAAAFDAWVAEATQSRLAAGVEFPSDVQAGLDLGKAVGAKVLEYARTDGFTNTGTLTIPVGPGFWTGTPVTPFASTWKTWVLPRANMFRPPEPPAWGSALQIQELAYVVNYPRALNTAATFATNAAAFYAQTPPGVVTDWYAIVNRHMLETRQGDNQPRMARAHALMGVTWHDAAVATWDAKLFYWRIRPFQAAPSLTPLFPTPNHPSYPAAHGTGSGSMAATIAFLFPALDVNDPARSLRGVTQIAKDNAEARIWAGIHYRSDVDEGLKLGRSVSNVIVAQRAISDGSQITESVEDCEKG